MRKKVLEVLCQVNPKIANHLEADLLETGLIDSFEIINVVMELERSLNVEIDPELVSPENFQTVDAIVELVDRIVYGKNI